MPDKELVKLLGQIIADAQHALAIVEGNVVTPGPVPDPGPDVPLGFYHVMMHRVPGPPKWELIDARHLPGAENQGKHHVYVYVWDEGGRRATNPNLRIGWTWEGRRPDEDAPPATLDKREGEPHGNVPIERGQVLSVWIEGDELLSDVVYGMHTKWGQDSPGNSLFHHSFELHFRRRVHP